MRKRHLIAPLACLALAGAIQPAAAPAAHVSAEPEASARLGERLGSQSWIVVVDWSINCRGAANPSHGGNLYLVDVDTGEQIYMGGTFQPSGSDRQSVARRTRPRRVQPRLKASCFENGPGLHGSGAKEVVGNVVTVPARGDEDGDGRVDPSGGGGGGGGGLGGGSTDPLRRGGCARRVVGTGRPDRLIGSGGGDLIFGLGGGDLIRGRSGHDCLLGAAGDDRLHGGDGWDRLRGGAGADLLVGGRGRNAYSGGPGRDRILAVNGQRDLVSCGPGRDRARVDRQDTVRGCESVTRVG